MHLYKEVSLTKLMEAENPLLVFAEFNKITTTAQERAKYYETVKRRPKDLDEMFDDIKVLGKREIGNILKWRGKVIHHFNQIKAKEEQLVEKEEQEKVEEQVDS